MQIFDVANLVVGRTFPETLFHASGRKLLSAKTPLTQIYLDALLRAGIERVFMAHHAKEVLDFSNTPAHLVSVSSLVLGTTAETDFLTPDGVVIIQQNEQVEEHHLAALKDSGIDFLLVRPSADVEAIRGMLEAQARVVMARVELTIQRGEYMRAPEALDPFLNSIVAGPAPLDEILNINAVQLMRRRLSSRLQPVYGMLETGKQPQHRVLMEITEDLLDLMRTEPRQFSQLALMAVGKEDYLPDHAFWVAVLAMAIGTHMKLSLELVKEVIMGALLCDVGMLAVPKRIRSSSGVLTEGDRARVLQHPVYSLSMMEQVPGLSPIARLMGFQHHERLNGTGYLFWHERRGDFRFYARIVAVADVFAAAANPRAYKTRKLPYTAMEELVHMAHDGLIDARVIKALLSAIGLFPVGSYVLLSNNMTAQVVGANAARIDRPLIRPVLAGANAGNAPSVDLAAARYGHIKIVRAVAGTVERAMVGVAS